VSLKSFYLSTSIGPKMNGYGWEVVSPSINSAYICEMSKTEAQRMKIEDRDFCK
jgi:hypothetical protein